MGIGPLHRISLDSHAYPNLQRIFQTCCTCPLATKMVSSWFHIVAFKASWGFAQQLSCRFRLSSYRQRSSGGRGASKMFLCQPPLVPWLLCNDWCSHKSEHCCCLWRYKLQTIVHLPESSSLILHVTLGSTDRHKPYSQCNWQAVLRPHLVVTEPSSCILHLWNTFTDVCSKPQTSTSAVSYKIGLSSDVCISSVWCIR